MLALVHPYSSSNDVPHRATPSPSSTSSRSRQSSRNNKQSTLSTSASLPPSIPLSRYTSASASNSNSSSGPSPQRSVPSALHRTQQQPQIQHNSSSYAIPNVIRVPTPPPALVASSSSSATTPIASEAPFDIHSYPPNDLLRLLASLLSQIAATNDKLNAASFDSKNDHMALHSPPAVDDSHSPLWQSLMSASRAALSTPSATLSFHARNIPTISLEAYLLRIIKYCPTTNEVFLSLLVYFDRMSKLSVDINAEASRCGFGPCCRPFVIDSYNVHRLVIAGVTVASKFFSDVFYTNSRYAKVGGLPQSELNQLELQFLLLNNFSLVIPEEEMQRYAEQLIAFSKSGSTPADISTLGSHPAPASFLNPNASSHISTPITPVQPIAVPPLVHIHSSTSSHGQMELQAAMGAVDAYGGQLRQNIPPSFAASHHHYPSTSYSSFASAQVSSSQPRTHDEESETDTENEGDTETEGGWTTDDEPTIRPHNSSGSEDSQSICSTDTEGDDGDDQMNMEPEERTPERPPTIAGDVERTPDGVLSGNKDHRMASP